MHVLNYTEGSFLNSKPLAVIWFKTYAESLPSLEQPQILTPTTIDKSDKFSIQTTKLQQSTEINSFTVSMTAEHHNVRVFEYLVHYKEKELYKDTI